MAASDNLADTEDDASEKVAMNDDSELGVPSEQSVEVDAETGIKAPEVHAQTSRKVSECAANPSNLRTPKLKSMARVVAKFEDAIASESDISAGISSSHSSGKVSLHSSSVSDSCQEYVSFLLAKSQGGIEQQKDFHSHLAQLRQNEQDKQEVLALARAQMTKQMERESGGSDSHAKKGKGAKGKQTASKHPDQIFQPYSSTAEVLQVRNIVGFVVMCLKTESPK
jgi:hypothetical protein